MIMGNRSNLGLVVVGIVGMAAGIYLMNRYRGSKTQRRLRYKGRALMRGLRSGVSTLGNIYQLGSKSVDQGMKVLRR